jgi:hypothetical protein
MGSSATAATLSLLATMQYENIVKKNTSKFGVMLRLGGYSTVKVQTLFGTSGRQKYFIVDIDEAESGENLDPDQVVTQQLSTWRLCHFIIRSKLCALVSMHESDVTACTRAR